MRSIVRKSEHGEALPEPDSKSAREKTQVRNGSLGKLGEKLRKRAGLEHVGGGRGHKQPRGHASNERPKRAKRQPRDVGEKESMHEMLF